MQRQVSMNRLTIWSPLVSMLFASNAYSKAVINWDDMAIDNKASLSLSANDSDLYQQSLSLNSRVELPVSETVTLHGDARLQIDTAQELRTSKSHLWLRELYLQGEWQNWEWQLGRQIHNWTQMDNLVSFEQVSPRDYHEFILPDFAQSGRGLWMLSAKRALENGQWHLLLVPQAEAHRQPTAPDWYQFRAPRLRYGFPFVQGMSAEQDYESPDKGLFAARYEGFEQQWQWSLQMRYGLDFEPLAQNQFSATGVPQGIALFHKNRLSLGAAASTTVGDHVFRAEMSFSPDRHFNTNQQGLLGSEKKDQFSLALGMDTFGPWDTFINLQVLVDRVSSHSATMVRPEEDLLWSATVRRSFANDSANLELRWYGSNEEDGLLRASVSYLINDNWELKAGLDSFYGKQQGYFGQYGDLDRTYINSHWYF